MKKHSLKSHTDRIKEFRGCSCLIVAKEEITEMSWCQGDLLAQTSDDRGQHKIIDITFSDLIFLQMLKIVAKRQ